MNDIRGVESVVADLRHELDDVDNRIADATNVIAIGTERRQQIQSAIAALSKLYGLNVQDVRLADQEGSDSTHYGVGRTGPDPVADADTTTQTEGLKRTHSTALVVEIVRDSGLPITRDDIRKQFHARGFVPATWAHPKNAIGNAVNRALAKGLIEESSPGLYSPPADQTLPDAPAVGGASR